MARVINKTKGFGTINRDCVFDNQLSDRARFVYVYMACKPETWDFYQDKVAEELGYKKDTLRKYLDELIVRGWLTEKEQQNDGKFGCLEYVIEVERKKGNLPIRKKPDTEKTRIGKSSNHRNIDNISSKHSLSDNKRDIEEKVDDKTSTKKRFVKPTIDQIAAYINEKKLHFDAEGFFDYYESKGWLVGKSPMKDWKAACRTWEHNRKSIDKKEESKEEDEPINLPAGMTADQWKRIGLWMCAEIPSIAGKISPMDFYEMKKLVDGNSEKLRDILKDINEYVSENGSLDVLEFFREIVRSNEAGNGHE